MSICIYDEGKYDSDTYGIGTDTGSLIGNACLVFNKEEVLIGNAKVSPASIAYYEGIPQGQYGIDRYGLQPNMPLIGNARLYKLNNQENLVGNAELIYIFSDDFIGNARLGYFDVQKSLIGNGRLESLNVQETIIGNASLFIEYDTSFEGTAWLTYPKHIYVDGVDYLANVFNYRYEDPLNDVPPAVLKIAGISPSNTDIAIDKEVRIVEGGKLRFFGVVRKVNYLDNDVAEITCKGYIIKFNDRKLYNSTSANYTTLWESTRTDSVCTDLVDGQNVLISGTLYDNGVDFDVKNQNDTMYKTVKRLAKFGLGDFEVTRAA